MYCTPHLQRHSAYVIGTVELLAGAVAGTPLVRIGVIDERRAEPQSEQASIANGKAEIAAAGDTHLLGRPLRRGVDGCWYRAVEAAGGNLRSSVIEPLTLPK
jgi:hypothetical protein